MKPSKTFVLASSLIAATAFAAFTSLSLIAQTAHADNLSNELDSLGGSPALVQEARDLEPDNQMAVVENRAVNLNWRLELGIDMGLVGGGDSYVNTQALGANADLHIDPHWSFGVRYLSYNNTLTAQGQQVFQQAESSQAINGGGASTAAVSYPLDTTLGVVSFYPIYGKLNLFNEAITQFDLYVLGGAGQTTSQANGLSPYTSTTWTAGGGVGFWWTQHFASRLEVRYQSYQDKILADATTRSESDVVTMFSLGILL